ncbi:ankyrin repeat domain-containing protein [Streptomyces sp. NBC_00370]|uniref:ankyrin repeat domain-containing protein n=1 Tax=Streptomyces sp. NBC_00370 TaxID=2975728 RepID=UPI002E274661
MNQRRRKKLTRRLFAAILEGDTTAVKTLLRAGIDPNRPDSQGTTPLYEASVNGKPEIAHLLLLAGATPNTESTGPGAEGTPLCAAASWGHTETVRTLLTHGADPNLPEDHGTGWTPLRWANHDPHPETADLLTAWGATPATDAGA